MIVDCLENWKIYPYGAAWKSAFEFLMTLTPNAEEKKYPLQGDDIYAMVMSYKTRTPETAVLETHRKYLDIQVVLDGGEVMEWFPTGGLVINKPYEESKDVEFYIRPHPGLARLEITPGMFVAFFPHDAHMPYLMIGNKSERVKKVVVKIKAELLMP